MYIREKRREREKRKLGGTEREGPDLQSSSTTYTTEYSVPVKLYWRVVITKSDIFIHRQYRFDNHHHFVKKYTNDPIKNNDSVLVKCSLIT